jgi:hypothetical protein
MAAQVKLHQGRRGPNPSDNSTATHYLSNGITEYKELFCGADNNIANALSQNNDRTVDKLTQILCSYCSSQLPKHFKIGPLPNKIVSWLTLLLQQLL